MTLKTANYFSHTKLQLMMLHHHIKFGNKVFCGSEDIIQTNNKTLTDNLTLHCDLDSNPFFFSQDTPAYDANQVLLQTDQHF